MGNSLRLRLRQAEVRRLLVDGAIEEVTTFGPAIEHRLSYTLYVSATQSGVNASFVECRIIIRVPASVVQEWASTDQVSIHGRQHAGEDTELRILIEKDFECIDAPADESQEDAFPNLQR